MVKPLECSTLGSKGTPPPCRTMHGVRRSCARSATPTVSQHLLLGVRRGALRGGSSMACFVGALKGVLRWQVL